MDVIVQDHSLERICNIFVKNSVTVHGTGNDRIHVTMIRNVESGKEMFLRDFRSESGVSNYFVKIDDVAVFFKQPRIVVVRAIQALFSTPESTSPVCCDILKNPDDVRLVDGDTWYSVSRIIIPAIRLFVTNKNLVKNYLVLVGNNPNKHMFPEVVHKYDMPWSSKISVLEEDLVTRIMKTICRTEDQNGKYLSEAIRVVSLISHIISYAIVGPEILQHVRSRMTIHLRSFGTIMGILNGNPDEIPEKSDMIRPRAYLNNYAFEYFSKRFCETLFGKDAAATVDVSEWLRQHLPEQEPASAQEWYEFMINLISCSYHDHENPDEGLRMNTWLRMAVGLTGCGILEREVENWFSEFGLNFSRDYLKLKTALEESPKISPRMVLKRFRTSGHKSSRNNRRATNRNSTL